MWFSGGQSLRPLVVISQQNQEAENTRARTWAGQYPRKLVPLDIPPTSEIPPTKTSTTFLNNATD